MWSNWLCEIKLYTPCTQIMKFFLIHQYSGNKGDRAVLYAMCRMILSEFPKSSISVATSNIGLWNNYDFYHKEKIEFTPWAWDFDNIESHNPYWKILNKFKPYTFTILREAFLRGFSLSRFLTNPRFFKKLRDTDVVISVGGHHFTTILSRDLVSGINYDAMSVLSCGKKLICFSQSFGPFVFHNKKNEILTRRLLSNSYLMPREEKSKHEIINFLGNGSSPYLTYESVLTMSKFIKYIPIAKRENYVGIAIYCTQYRNKADKDAYQKTVAYFCDHAINCGYAIKFFPMEIKGSGPDDRPFISEIISKVKNGNKCIVIDDDLETLNHLNEVSKCKVFVGHKTHSTIFALATGTPLIGIAYHPKTIEFLKQFNIESNAIGDKELNTSNLCSIFDNIISNLDYLSRMEFKKANEIADIINADFKLAVESTINKSR